MTFLFITYLASFFSTGQDLPPLKVGRRLIFFQETGKGLYVQDSLKKEPRVLIDSDVDAAFPSFDGKYLAYRLKDRQEIHLIEMKTGKTLKDVLEKVAPSPIAWKGRGFYYVAYPSKKLYYHKIGTSQESDELIYADACAPRTTEDGHLLLFVSRQGKKGTSVLRQAKGGWETVVDNFDHINELIDLIEERCYLLQDKKIFIYDLNQKTTLPFLTEVEGDIQSVSYVGGLLFVTTLHDGSSEVLTCNLEGGSRVKLALPSKGTITPFQGLRRDKYTFYLTSSPTQPAALYRYLINKNQSLLFLKGEYTCH